jgi:hypothetical protein
MSSTGTIIWLASYPKCGNTWVRFLLYAALYGPARESIEVSRRIPDIHRPLPATPPGNGPLMAKTHFMLTDRHPRLADTARAIHIVRHPRDVLLSALNYRRLGGMDEKALPAARYADLFIRSGGDPDWLAQGFGTWAQHANSWRSTDRFPVLALRYEDLKSDAAGELGRMLTFLGIDRTAEQIATAAKSASFEAMRAMEIREKNDRSKKAPDKRLFVGDDKAARAGHFFMNSGQSGRSLESISPGLDARLDAAFAEGLRACGY